ncbi:hypothetical protein ElP_62460 [Tautonia plasticadhaerens]|uniref:Dirigent protein n=2 Tax=Tautonia plasticadhaerens TaxID=2527974 RepID=A0A518HBS3_9BACT|nr:hypothetical protein ElP_62460 [Tautonia plasticadhaerens]
MMPFAKPCAALALFLLCSPAPAGDLVRLKADARETAFVPLSFDGRFLVADVYGAGRGSHLGRFTYSSPHVFDLQTGAFTATAVITAANGDVLRMEMVGQLLSDTESISAFRIVGGTGRFLHAAGQGTVDRRDDGAEILIEGSISTVGSGR